MSPRTEALNERVHAYFQRVGLREAAPLARLRQETDRLADGGMRSSAEQTQLLAYLVELIGARTLLEVGCFTGYTTLALALAAGEAGRVVTLDVNEDWAEIGRRYWREAGVESRIELRLGLALESLDLLLRERGEGSFDLAYIDADKKGYALYLERIMRLVRAGGVIALDNMLWGGRLADPDETSRQAKVLRELNERLHGDPRVAYVMLPIGDGVTLLRRR
jgi:predicted O-methyltransferase YrrM